MKLQMKNQLSFQTAEGYEDDPCPVTEDDVKEQLMYWHDLLVKADDERELEPDLVNLEAFLYNLAEGEVEYTDPAHEYEYLAGFEYTKPISVYAYSQEEADRLAREHFRDLVMNMPPTVGGQFDHYQQALFNLKWLERDDASGYRIVEE